MNQSFDVVIAGAGIFGVSTALALRRRGYLVAVLDPGPLPHPLAASTDISKVVRIEYADDDDYARLAEQSREGWLRWNAELEQPLYHDIGVVMLTGGPMAPGEYEYESHQSLLRRGYQVERLDSQAIARRFPAFNPARFVDGYYHAEAGYVESGRAVAALLKQAEREGVTLLQGHTVTAVRTAGGRAVGVHTMEGTQVSADWVVIAAGAWTPYLLPELQPYLRIVGMPVFHLKPLELTLFEPPRFVVFSADVTRTGWYGFPLHPVEGVVKIAHHGAGVPLHPAHDERVVTERETADLRAFLASSIPALADAPIVYTRRCLYCDTLDEHFWIDRHPEIEGLIVATGGSGHAFKFGPLLGDLVADALDGRPNPDLRKFRWRSLPPGTPGEEASRYRGRTGDGFH